MLLVLLLLSQIAGQSDAGLELTDEQMDATLMESEQTMQLVFSLVLCEAQLRERHALKSIKQAKADSKIAGVVDLHQLKELQDQVVYARGRIKLHTGSLKLLKLKPLACSAEPVKVLAGCMEDAEGEICSDRRMQAFVRLTERVLEEAGEALAAQ